MGLATSHFNTSACNKTLHRAPEMDGSLGTATATEHGPNYERALGGLIWLRIGKCEGCCQHRWTLGSRKMWENCRLLKSQGIIVPTTPLLEVSQSVMSLHNLTEFREAAMAGLHVNRTNVNLYQSPT